MKWDHLILRKEGKACEQGLLKCGWMSKLNHPPGRGGGRASLQARGGGGGGGRGMELLHRISEEKYQRSFTFISDSWDHVFD